MTVLDPKIFTLTTPAISALVAMLIVLYDVFEEGGDQRRTKLKLVLFLHQRQLQPARSLSISISPTFSV